MEFEFTALRCLNHFGRFEQRFRTFGNRVNSLLFLSVERCSQLGEELSVVVDSAQFTAVLLRCSPFVGHEVCGKSFGSSPHVSVRVFAANYLFSRVRPVHEIVARSRFGLERHEVARGQRQLVSALDGHSSLLRVSVDANGARLSYLVANNERKGKFRTIVERELRRNEARSRISSNVGFERVEGFSRVEGAVAVEVDGQLRVEALGQRIHRQHKGLSAQRLEAKHLLRIVCHIAVSMVSVSLAGRERNKVFVQQALCHFSRFAHRLFVILQRSIVRPLPV